MAERTVISPHYSWLDSDGDLQTAFRGAIINVSDEEAAKGDALNCFLGTRVEYEKPGTPVEPEPSADFTEDGATPPKRTSGRRAKPRVPESNQ